MKKLLFPKFLKRTFLILEFENCELKMEGTIGDNIFDVRVEQKFL